MLSHFDLAWYGLFYGIVKSCIRLRSLFFMMLQWFTGGTFALYSLICRHAKTNTIPNQHPTDHALTTYRLIQSDERSMARRVKKWLEESHCSQRMLVILVLVGTSMLIGDGILTPAISGTGSVSTDRVFMIIWDMWINKIVKGIYARTLTWITIHKHWLELMCENWFGVKLICEHQDAHKVCCSSVVLTQRYVWRILGSISTEGCYSIKVLCRVKYLISYSHHQVWTVKLMCMKSNDQN